MRKLFIYIYLFLSIFAGIGLSSIGIGIHSTVLAQQSVSWLPVSAKIVRSELIESTIKRKKSYKPDIAYQYMVAGKTYLSANVFHGQGISYTGSYAQDYVNKYPESTAITAKYNPSHPDQAVVEAGITKRTFIPITLGSMFFCFSVNFALIVWGETKKSGTLMSIAFCSLFFCGFINAALLIWVLAP